MTFELETTVSTIATPAAVWALWSDSDTWSQWDPAVERVVLDGPFEVGATGTLTLTGPMEVPFLLETVEPDARYLDRLTIGELVVQVDHLVRAHPEGGSEITVRTTVEGPGSDAIGPMVTADTPRALESLVRLAENA